MGGDKIVSVLHLMPYLEMGWAAVNINYHAGKGTAPAAVKDCRCALRWVIRNAQKYNFDIDKIIVSGESAGAHLALTTGMLPKSAGFDDACAGDEKLNVGAIINWYGAADVVDLIEGENKIQFAADWFDGLTEGKQIALSVSPIQYVRSGLPPILTIHGDADAVVPYNQAVSLHKKLDEAKVTNQLITVKGGYHGGFKSEEMIKIYETIREFLKEHLFSKF